MFYFCQVLRDFVAVRYVHSGMYRLIEGISEGPLNMYHLYAHFLQTF